MTSQHRHDQDGWWELKKPLCVYCIIPGWTPGGHLWSLVWRQTCTPISGLHWPVYAASGLSKKKHFYSFLSTFLIFQLCFMNIRYNNELIIVTTVKLLKKKKEKSLDILELPSSSFCVSTSSGPGTSMTRGSGQCQVLACCSCLSWSSADSKCTSCSSGSTVAMVGSSVMRAAVPWSSQRSSILARPSSVRGPWDDWLTEITHLYGLDV